MKTFYKTICAVFLFSVAGVHPASAGPVGPVTAICVDMKRPPHICACATERLRDKQGATDFDLYEAVAKEHRALRDKGMRFRMAWSSATRNVAQRQSIGIDDASNRLAPMSDKHLQAVMVCSQQK